MFQVGDIIKSRKSNNSQGRWQVMGVGESSISVICLIDRFGKNPTHMLGYRYSIPDYDYPTMEIDVAFNLTKEDCM